MFLWKRRRPPRSTRADTRLPYTALCRSAGRLLARGEVLPHLVGRLHLQPHARLREAGFAQPRHQLAPLHRGVGLVEIVERKGLHAILELLDQLQEAFRAGIDPGQAELGRGRWRRWRRRSEEPTSELQ